MAISTVIVSTTERECTAKRLLPPDDFDFYVDICNRAQAADKAAAGRAKGFTERNKAEGKAVRDGLRMVLKKQIEFGATPDKLTYEKVHSFLERNDPARYGLKRIPCERIVNEEIKKLK